MTKTEALKIDPRYVDSCSVHLIERFSHHRAIEYPYLISLDTGGASASADLTRDDLRSIIDWCRRALGETAAVSSSAEAA